MKSKNDIQNVFSLESRNMHTLLHRTNQKEPTIQQIPLSKTSTKSFRTQVITNTNGQIIDKISHIETTSIIPMKFSIPKLLLHKSYEKLADVDKSKSLIKYKMNPQYYFDNYRYLWNFNQELDLIQCVNNINSNGMVTFIPKYPLLPPKSPEMPNLTVILDLDETLVHALIEPELSNCFGYSPLKPAFTFTIGEENDRFTFSLNIRPYVTYFLTQLAKDFEVVVFTASSKRYAETVTKLLDPTGTIFSHVLCRESCVRVNGNFVKNLGLIGRDLSTTVLIDNSIVSFAQNIDNGIPIISFFDHPEDDFLLRILPFLHNLKLCSDVRHCIRQRFQIKNILCIKPEI